MKKGIIISVTAAALTTLLCLSGCGSTSANSVTAIIGNTYVSEAGVQYEFTQKPYDYGASLLGEDDSDAEEFSTAIGKVYQLHGTLYTGKDSYGYIISDQCPVLQYFSYEGHDPYKAITEWKPCESGVGTLVIVNPNTVEYDLVNNLEASNVEFNKVVLGDKGIASISAVPLLRVNNDPASAKEFDSFTKAKLIVGDVSDDDKVPDADKRVDNMRNAMRDAGMLTLTQVPK
ncbi:hypothetical protein D2E26_0216 [Bifidobacterium dolichotidis]|uniref:Lipoprotein n=1 Tax=Bifidobacterium dolichotidis TaxID=2306976 RepID=A0A430FS24_9BIFI|nr:hypothetical protein [Bifidobacterium dolichotidis]RSX55653.1 hypothetical protein D2E26_0216 [Bifidobacterium dolichotidis]